MQSSWRILVKTTHKRFGRRQNVQASFLPRRSKILMKSKWVCWFAVKFEVVLFSHIVCQPSWHFQPERLQNSTWQEILSGKTNKLSRYNENLSFCSKVPSHCKMNAITRVNIVLRRTEQLCTEYTWKENFELQTKNFSQNFDKVIKIASVPFKSYS